MHVGCRHAVPACLHRSLAALTCKLAMQHSCASSPCLATHSATWTLADDLLMLAISPMHPKAVCTWYAWLLGGAAGTGKSPHCKPELSGNNITPHALASNHRLDACSCSPVDVKCLDGGIQAAGDQAQLRNPLDLGDPIRVLLMQVDVILDTVSRVMFCSVSGVHKGSNLLTSSVDLDLCQCQVRVTSIVISNAQLHRRATGPNSCRAVFATVMSELDRCCVATQPLRMGYC